MKTSKINYFIYFYTYFVAQVIFIFINVYLPIYFFNVMNVNRIELAFIQIFVYSTLFIKPIIAIYIEKKFTIMKLLLIISSICVLISFIFFLSFLNILIIFGIFLGINLVFLSIIDVIIDKIIVNFSLDEKRKDRNILFTQIGLLLGALYPNIISFLIFTDIYSIPTWNLFFLLCIVSVSPIICIGFLLKINIEMNVELERSFEKKIEKKNIALLGIFIFLIYSERLYEYPLEPWILNKYGEENLSLFIGLFAILILIHALSVILASIISNKLNRKRILITFPIMYGGLMIIAPFTGMIWFFIIFGIMQLLYGFILINFISLMIDFSEKKVTYFQMMVTFAILASVIFIPLGTYLSAFIATELIIVIAGILTIVSVIPICFIKIKKMDVEDFK